MKRQDLKEQSDIKCPRCKQDDIDVSIKEGTLLLFCNSCMRFFQPMPKFWEKVQLKNVFSTE